VGIPAESIGGLPLTIHNPIIIYRATWGSNSWYGQSIPVRQNLWDYYEKSDHDPCPKGWKVAQKGFYQNMMTLPPTPYANYGFQYSDMGYFPGGDYVNTTSMAMFFGTNRGLYHYTSNTVDTDWPVCFNSNGAITYLKWVKAAEEHSIRCMKDE
jgi:hypothetical protein